MKEKNNIDNSNQVLSDFQTAVSGVNCTIPTLWKANRLRSAASSAFVLSTEDQISQPRKRKQQPRRRIVKQTYRNPKQVNKKRPIFSKGKRNITDSSLQSHTHEHDSGFLINVNHK